jgi:hypothetical protein
MLSRARQMMAEGYLKSGQFTAAKRLCGITAMPFQALLACVRAAIFKKDMSQATKAYRALGGGLSQLDDLLLGYIQHPLEEYYISRDLKMVIGCLLQFGTRETRVVLSQTLLAQRSRGWVKHWSDYFLDQGLKCLVGTATPEEIALVGETLLVQGEFDGGMAAFQAAGLGKPPTILLERCTDYLTSKDRTTWEETMTARRAALLLRDGNRLRKCADQMVRFQPGSVFELVGWLRQRWLVWKTYRQAAALEEKGTTSNSSMAC